MSSGNSIEDSIVKYCRNAFGKRYTDMWINPIYFDDKYLKFTEDFFSEVYVELYPKITNTRKELKRLGYAVPPPIKKGMSREERDAINLLWNEYRDVVWRIIHNDINTNQRNDVKPICVKVTGVRIPKQNGSNISYAEKIIGVKEIKE